MENKEQISAEQQRNDELEKAVNDIDKDFNSFYHEHCNFKNFEDTKKLSNYIVKEVLTYMLSELMTVDAIIEPYKQKHFINLGCLDELSGRMKMIATTLQRIGVVLK